MFKSFTFSALGLLVLPLSTHAMCAASPAVERGVDTEACSPAAVYVYLDQKTAMAGESAVIVAAEVLSSNRTNVSNGTEVTFFLQREDATVRVSSTTRDGIAHAELDAGNMSGPAYVWAEAADTSSDKQRIQILASAPTSFSLSIAGCNAGVYCLVESTNIRDGFGNRVPDGVAGTLRTFSGDYLISQQTVHTLRGSVQANWKRPQRDARIELVFGQSVASLEVPSR